MMAMIRMCAWCNRHLGFKDGPDRVITHGICPDCYERVFGALTGVPLSDVLERLEVPLFLMDDDARVVAANRPAAHAVGKDAAQLDGIYAGDVVQCVNAGRPGGCGKTAACSTCVLRRTVEDTYATGRTHAHVRTTLQRAVDGGAAVDLQISTERVARGVLLRLDEVAAREPADRHPTEAA